jgi:hypothetical protein
LRFFRKSRYRFYHRTEEIKLRVMATFTELYLSSSTLKMLICSQSINPGSSSNSEELIVDRVFLSVLIFC